LAIAAAVISANGVGGCSANKQEEVSRDASASVAPDGPAEPGLPRAAEAQAHGDALGPPEAGASLAAAGASGAPRPEPSLSVREELGRRIFFDARLSSPPGTSCASCHDPARAFAGNHGGAGGVALGSRPGHFSTRNTPSVLYVKYVPAFHFALEDDDDVVESAFGGFGWSGRADSVAEFSRLPLFDPDEMNNRSDYDLALKIRSGPYASAFAQEFPEGSQGAEGVVAATGQALEAFLTSAAMAPFSSKYDDYLRHTATLTALERRGLALFKDPDKGACDACHRFEDSSNRPSRSLFTNYGYDALAVPRNREIPANADPHHYDLGLCERRAKTARSSAPNWCADFRTPSLRNVAVRGRFMHNGAFAKLRDVVAFYATRSTNPERWYPNGAKFDDVPAMYRGNVNVSSLPYNRREGVAPAYDDGDIDAIVAFLETLTDAPYRSLLASK
jgi:cytochrome c peroxidase